MSELTISIHFTAWPKPVLFFTVPVSRCIYRFFGLFWIGFLGRLRLAVGE